MAVETFPQTSEGTEDNIGSPDAFKQWDQQLEENTESTVDQFDDQESIVSPIGERITKAANRIADFLNRRASDRKEQANFNERENAHADALDEYRKRDLPDYVDHIAQVAESDNPDAAEYGQGQLSKEKAKADRQEMLDAARGEVLNFGKAALHGAKEAGYLSIGLGIKSARKAGELANQASSAAETGAMKVGMTAGELASKSGSFIQDAEAVVGAKIAHRIDETKGFIAEQKQNHLGRQYENRLRRDYKAEMKAETIAEKSAMRVKKLNEKIAQKAERVENREAMRANIIARANKARENVTARASRFGNKIAIGAEAVGNKAGEVKMGFEARANASRAAGHAAVEAYLLTSQSHKEQNAVDRR